MFQDLSVASPSSTSCPRAASLPGMAMARRTGAAGPMASVLDGVDAAIERNRTETDMLKSLKESTADALLTRRVRIKVGCAPKTMAREGK